MKLLWSYKKDYKAYIHAPLPPGPPTEEPTQSGYMIENGNPYTPFFWKANGEVLRLAHGALTYEEAVVICQKHFDEELDTVPEVKPEIKEEDNPLGF